MSDSQKSKLNLATRKFVLPAKKPAKGMVHKQASAQPAGGAPPSQALTIREGRSKRSQEEAEGQRAAKRGREAPPPTPEAPEAAVVASTEAASTADTVAAVPAGAAAVTDPALPTIPEEWVLNSQRPPAVASPSRGKAPMPEGSCIWLPLDVKSASIFKGTPQEMRRTAVDLAMNTLLDRDYSRIAQPSLKNVEQIIHYLKAVRVLIYFTLILQSYFRPP